MQDVVVLGAGGGAKSVLWLLETMNEDRPRWNVLGLIDDNPDLHPDADHTRHSPIGMSTSPSTNTPGVMTRR